MQKSNLKDFGYTETIILLLEGWILGTLIAPRDLYMLFSEVFSSSWWCRQPTFILPGTHKFCALPGQTLLVINGTSNSWNLVVLILRLPLRTWGWLSSFINNPDSSHYLLLFYKLLISFTNYPYHLLLFTNYHSQVPIPYLWSKGRKMKKEVQLCFCIFGYQTR